jgi:outer membrane protein TolC|tara:strand:- start:110 stop:1375 length:1266 start_codon:yes stop_codon:yes gene_type:complete
MAKNKIIILITLFIFNITSSNAYEILELIEILNKKNQTESIFYYDNKINRLNIKNSYSSFYPSVSYSNKTSDTETKTSSTSSVSSNTHSLSVDLNLYNGGYTNQNIIETKNKNYANSSLDEYKKLLLIKELILGYYNLKSLTELNQISKNNINFYSNRLKEAEILFEAGRLSKIDLLNFKSAKMNSENDLFDINNEIDNLMLKISNLLDMNITFDEVQLDYEIIIPESLIKEKKLSDLMNSSYGRYLSFMEKTYLPEMKKNKKDLLPSVDLGYDFTDTDKFSSTIGNRSSSSISLTITVPIFNGYRKVNNFDIKKYEYEKKILDHKDMVKNFYTDYKINFNNYNNILNKINSQMIIVKSNQLKHDGSKILYKADRINVNELIDSQASLDQSINNLNQLNIDLKDFAINIIIYNGEFSKIIN